jgi:FHS family glucose/mannose:H+ symporter-like MFS transporter
VRNQAVPATWKAVVGFLLSGYLFALLGAILPAWELQQPFDFDTVGNYFLSLSLGVIVSSQVAPLLQRRGRPAFLLVFACVLACVALLFLSLVPPPAPAGLRMLGLVAIGMATGTLNTALFHAISRNYRNDPAGTVNTGGIFYGFGCLAAALLVAATFYVRSILTFVAIVPGAFAGIYANFAMPLPEHAGRPTPRQALRDLRSTGAILFALLLFFQFGNEWSIAGWLPLFVIHHLGKSPKSAILLLAFYWMSLLVGRTLAVSALPRLPHGKLLSASVLSAMFGCLILAMTNNMFGAGSGILLIGAGFASIYPLVAEKIGRRFPHDNPGLFNGIFSFALMGGMLAPASLGYAADQWGIRAVMWLPALGTSMVFVLLLLIWLEAKVTGR